MRKTLILDSSQIATHFECPEKHHLAYVENLANSTEVDEPITAGTYGHKLLELYYKNIHLGQSRAVSIALDFKSEDHGEVYPLSPERLSLVRERFGHYWMSYCTKDIEPLYKTRPVIKFDASGMVPHTEYERVPLVEQGFTYKLLDTSEYLFALEGKVDILGTFAGNTVFMDHKFQFRQRDLYKKRIQFKNYALATGCTIGIANYIRLHAKVTPQTLSRDVISFMANELKWWREELIEVYIDIVKDNERPRRRHNWDSCEGKYGYKCIYTPICEELGNEQLIQVIKQGYVKREEWRPW